MKYFFTLMMLCAFGLMANAQSGNQSTNPGLIILGPTDLVMQSASMPANASPGQVIPITIFVKNQGEPNNTPTTMVVQIEYAPFMFHTITVTVPPFNSYDNLQVITVYFQIPAWLSPGSPIYISLVEVDANDDIAEANENNNLTIPNTPPTIVN